MFPPALTNALWSARIERVLPKSGPVAQLGARFHGMEEVIGSIPIRSTNYSNNLDRTFWEQGGFPGNSMGTLHFRPVSGSGLRLPAKQ
jgi:hypothetical protein